MYDDLLRHLLGARLHLGMSKMLQTQSEPSKPLQRPKTSSPAKIYFGGQSTTDVLLASKQGKTLDESGHDLFRKSWSAFSTHFVSANALGKNTNNTLQVTSTSPMNDSLAASFDSENTEKKDSEKNDNEKKPDVTVRNKSNISEIDGSSSGAKINPLHKDVPVVTTQQGHVPKIPVPQIFVIPASSLNTATSPCFSHQETNSSFKKTELSEKKFLQKDSFLLCSPHGEKRGVKQSSGISSTKEHDSSSTSKRRLSISNSMCKSQPVNENQQFLHKKQQVAKTRPLIASSAKKNSTSPQIKPPRSWLPKPPVDLKMEAEKAAGKEAEEEQRLIEEMRVSLGQSSILTERELDELVKRTVARAFKKVRENVFKMATDLEPI